MNYVVLSKHILYTGIVLEMLKEMKEANKKLQEDFKKLSEKMESEEHCARPTKRKRVSPSPEIRVSKIMYIDTQYQLIVICWYRFQPTP